jgi:phage terminase large subunit GpA-like protein
VHLRLSRHRRPEADLAGPRLARQDWRRDLQHRRRYCEDAIYARLNIAPPEPGQSKPGFVHFPVADNFGPEYFDQLNSERRVVRKRLGQSYIAWEQVRERNEALDTFVGALAMRKSLPRFIEKGLEYSVTHDTVQEETAEQEPRQPVSNEPPLHTAYINENSPERVRMREMAANRTRNSFIGDTSGWLRRN